MADLENFCIKLLDMGFQEIGLHKLRYEISKEFGYSKFIHDTTFKALMEYGFIEDNGRGGFDIKLLKSQQEAKKEAEKEADELLGKFE